MSLVPGVNNPEIDNLVQSSLESDLRLEWIPYEDITDIASSQIDNVYYASCKRMQGYEVVETPIMLLSLGSSEEFARIYSLPTHQYNKDVNQFRRYKRWLTYRNKQIH